MGPFEPLFRNPHLQTVAGHFWPRRLDRRRWPSEARLYRTEPEVQVRVESQRPSGETRGEVVMVHGLEGSAEAGYMLSLSQAALEAEFAAHRFQMRTCGGTEHLCQTLYHAGLTRDLAEVLHQMRAEGRAPVHLVGFSLGGNLVLKLAGELGESAADLVRSVCAASTPLDLAACTRRIARRENRLYEQRFIRRMRKRLCATGRYRREDFAGLNSIYAVDDRITAPSFGFGTAENYYATQSCGRFLDGIRVPALLIQAKDDTFIPFDDFERHATIRSNHRIRLIATDHGGHLGFLARGNRRFWLDAAIMEWIRQQSG